MKGKEIGEDIVFTEVKVMPKYDDFGRPIYETAEEYNRAHRMESARIYNDQNDYGQSRRRRATRNQTAAKRHAVRENLKDARSLILGIVVFVMALSIVMFFGISNNMLGVARPEPMREPYEVEVSVEAEYVDEEYLGDTDTPLPEGFESFTFDGIWITLPTTCKEIVTLGYEFKGYDEIDVVPEDFLETIDLIDEEENAVARIMISNDLGGYINLEECTVIGFYIDNPARYREGAEVPDFVFGNDITFESSYEDVEAFLGEPFYHYTDYTEEYCYDSYEWSYYEWTSNGECERHFVMVNFLNGEISDISIEKEVY